jgi:hypothetical protein
LSRNKKNVLLRKLIFRPGGKARLRAAWVALCAGITLLLLSVTIWWNFRELLQGRSKNDSLGSTFLTVNKKITDANMGAGAGNLFSDAEIDALKHAPQVQDVGALNANKFPVSASMGGAQGFYTELFLEAVPGRFMDKKPSDWGWQPGQVQVPIIVSAEFLNLYNYGFAPSQGLPQLSESTIQSLGFEMTIGSAGVQEKYIGHIVGFSDRITSVLVPETFMDYANGKFGRGSSALPSRLIIKTNDPSDKAFGQFLEAHNYSTNAEQLRWNKVRAIVEIVTLATGVLAVLLIGISTLVFVLFIELTLAKANESIQLLLQLGYSPSYLGSFVLARFIPVVASCIVVAVLLGSAAQAFFSVWIKKLQLEAAPVPGWPVWAVVIISTVVLLLFVRRTVRNGLK